MGTVPIGTGELAMIALTDARDVAAGRQVHHSVGAVLDGIAELVQLFVDVRGGSGVSNVGVDLALGCHADTHGLQVHVMNVGGDDHAAARYLGPDHFRSQPFPVRNVVHFFRDDSLAGIVHLGANRIRESGGQIFSAHVRLF